MFFQEFKFFIFFEGFFFIILSEQSYHLSIFYLMPPQKYPYVM